MSPWVIFGCGYTGTRLAMCLRAAGVKVVAPAHAVADVTRPETLRGLIPAGAVVVDSVPPQPTGPHAAGVVEAAAAANARRVVYLGSTGVYARGDGSWVDEDTPVAPEGARGQARVAAETALFAAAAHRGLEAVALRIAAIYGPGRGVAARLRAGTYRIVGDGAQWVSRIHVHDLVSVIVAAGTVTPLPRRVYVVGDDEPATARVHAEELARRLGLPPPPAVPLASVPPETAELVLGNRRVRNARLHSELGVTLSYPSWRNCPS